MVSEPSMTLRITDGYYEINGIIKTFSPLGSYHFVTLVLFIYGVLVHSLVAKTNKCMMWKHHLSQQKPKATPPGLN